MEPTVKTVANQPSWVIRNQDVELCITRVGGHMAPVTFHRQAKTAVQPYYLSPWQKEDRKIAEPVLKPLRGDFFCMPFGANPPYRGEKHRVHGEPAGRTWRLGSLTRDGEVLTLRLSLRTRVKKGKITKEVHLVDGHNAVYLAHTLEGYNATVPLGHHATLAMPEKPGDMRIAISPFHLGLTCPVLFSDPAEGEYQSLAIGESFTDLREVPTLWKDPPTRDCSSFPGPAGYDDLVSVFRKPDTTPAWTAAVVASQGYLWYALKDPAVLPATVMWMSNRGRHGEPWNGRNACLGLEDVCGYFAEGLGASAGMNEVNRAGFFTALTLSESEPTTVRYIQGATKVPRGFKQVRSASFEPGMVRFTSLSGKTVAVPVRHEFLADGAPADT
jgi:hypothetical protein